MQRGIKVVSWDSGVAPAGRQIHLNPSNNALIGETNVKLAADALKALNVEKGDVAVLSATPTSTNQNIWIEEMKKVLPQYPSVNLVTVAYGDDLSDKSYREAVGLLKSYPDLKVIVSPSSVGIVAAAQAVKDQGKIGKVYVTGLGLPSEMAGAIKSGASKSFAIWNPIDLGYAATYLADDLVKGTATKTEASMGKLGKVKLDADGMARWPSRSSTMRATSISSRKFSNPCSSPGPLPRERGKAGPLRDAASERRTVPSPLGERVRVRVILRRTIMSASTPLLSLKGITKIFPGVRALENVQLDLWPGKVTALIGENGAGKSTLVKVMTGIYQPEEGEILYKAIPFICRTPESAHKVGITAIHQETVLFDELSVSENIFVGQYLYKAC
jgi:rhamnose ABC transporter rhamnose-binding protein